MSRVSQGFIGIGRRSIHYRAARGPGPAVLLVHGSGATSAVWDGFIDVLGGTADLVAIDLHGVGGTSPWPGPRRLGLEDEAELLLSAGMELFGERAFHVVAHGYGAAVALCAAILAPEALASVTTVDAQSLGLLERLEPDSEALPPLMSQRDRFMRWMRDGDPLEAMAGWTAHFHGPEVWPGLARDVRLGLVGLADAVEGQWHAQATDRTTMGDLRSLRVPLLVMCGAASGPTLTRLSQLLHGHAPRGRFEILDAVGHDGLETHPTIVAGTWSRHWREGRSRPARRAMPASAAE
ncbi:MAG: alpha/beta hydrolase [Deltaproteobacteria bacterium]|nr:alpha/beta hydrolase [Deltaproteobacteria bacterium]